MRFPARGGRSPCLVVLCAGLAVLVWAAPAPATTAGWAPTLPVLPEGQTYLSLFRGGQGYAFTTNTQPLLFRTRDSGLSWAPVPPPTIDSSATGMVRFATPGLGFAESNGRMAKTNDGGAHWSSLTQVKAPPPPAGDRPFTSIDALEAGVDGPTIVFGGEAGSIHDGCPVRPGPRSTFFTISHDGGRTWRLTRVPHNLGVSRVDFVDRANGVAIVMDGRMTAVDCGWSITLTSQSVLVTHDGGRTFQEVLRYDIPTIADTDVLATAYRGFTAVAMASPRRVMVLRADNSYLLSDDGGKHFRRYPPILTPVDSLLGTAVTSDLAVVEFASASVGYLAIDGGGVWRTADGAKTWTEELSDEDVIGAEVGDLAVGDAEHAIVGGPHFVSARISSMG